MVSTDESIQKDIRIDLFTTPKDTIDDRVEVLETPKDTGTLDRQRAIWVAQNVLALPRDLCSSGKEEVVLHSSSTARLEKTETGVKAADISQTLVREIGNQTLPDLILAKFPHLKEHIAFNLDGSSARPLLKSQLAVTIVLEGRLIYVTGVQTAGCIDDLCSYDGPLGVEFEGSSVHLRLWAPTAQSVRLVSYDSAINDAFEKVKMTEETKGVWSTTLPRAKIEGLYFNYELEVFCPWTNRIHTVTATDPYSHSLAANGTRTQVADLSSGEAKPPHWDDMRIPPGPHPVDMSIYELHVRDFSVNDSTVPPELRGTYGAFDLEPKVGGGVAHLKALAEAGLTHIHLLPCYDFGTVDEVKAKWQSPVLPVGINDLREMPPDSEQQQDILSPVFDNDAFNWGYDPVHYSAPEGSYAVEPEGLNRVKEFRGMVRGLWKLNLRTVMDVVYNHVLSSGPDARESVLDKVVPGYYLRRNVWGEIECSTCMNNTASEHYMFDRLIVDSVSHWAREYKVSGFRFDLMGHLMLSTMQRIRARLDTLTREKDGIDGKSIYLYGEGWEFGEVAGCARGLNASQLHLTGTGIGSFSDRIREAVVGGNPFGDPRVQGFVTGMGTQHNGFEETKDPSHQMKVLSVETERLIVGLAGNLADYKFLNSDGNVISGKEAGHPGSNCGYAASPVETVNYVSAHDNETLFDMMVWKLKGGQGPEVYARRSLLCTALVAYAQGVPFFHAGDETLRSKSLDRDSYNSGDHYNRLDWSLSSNNFGVGLPPKSKNGEKWPLMRELLASKKDIAPPPALIARTVAAFRELLAVRYSSPLFRLRSAADIAARVRFYNRGADSTPGVIVMEIVDRPSAEGQTPLDPKYERIVLVCNARPEPHTHTEASLLQATRGLTLRLHPILATSADEVTRTATWKAGEGPTVPASTCAIFVSDRLTNQSCGLL